MDEYILVMSIKVTYFTDEYVTMCQLWSPVVAKGLINAVR